MLHFLAQIEEFTPQLIFQGKKFDHLHVLFRYSTVANHYLLNAEVCSCGVGRYFKFGGGG
jgi:hypothetical protein